MLAHLRGIAWLLGLTVAICCVLYPLALWGSGQAAFRQQAEGSLIEKDNEVVGSRLIGQPFPSSDGKGYFHARPSSAGSTPNGYDARASGPSNLAASNVKLRNQVARLLGGNARFRSPKDKEGQPVGPDVEAWFARADRVTPWAKDNEALTKLWVAADPLNKTYVEEWSGQPGHADLVALWKNDNRDAGDKPKAEDLAPYFFADFARVHPGQWPVPDDKKDDKGNTVKDDKGQAVREMTLVTAGDDLQQTFFESWFQAEKPDLKPVPADMVLGSGSGLDPHITRKNAEYQAARVAEERARARKMDPAVVKKVVDDLIGKHSFSPMWGLAGGDELVHVTELNLALDRAMEEFKP